MRTDDFLEYGFESEFIGRLPVVAILHELGKEDLLSILRSPKSSVILANKRDFRAYGIDIEFSDEALEILAARAHEEKTGARSLVGAVERALLPFEKKLPSSAVRQFTINGAVINEPQVELLNLLSTSSLGDFCQSFSQKHGIELHIAPEAEALILQIATEKESAPSQLCETLFADYGHGLKLAELTEYTISVDAVRDPQEALNQLIRAFYNRSKE